jgi:ubiquinone/menaquinone biosynthesis C-methylase UbiE
LTDFDEDIARARGFYTARAGDPNLAKAYGAFEPDTLYTAQSREWAIADLLRRSGLSSLADLDILDVGCGTGAEMRRMTTYGAEPARLVGIDVTPVRIEEARRALPTMRFELGSAHEMPFPDASFDLVTQFVTLCSVTHPGLRKAIADEMVRVVRPAGIILSYDICKMRPNPDLVPIDLAELRRLFPGCAITTRMLTLEWNLNRRVVPRSRIAASLLEKLPGTRNHYVALIRAAGPGTKGQLGR